MLTTAERADLGRLIALRGPALSINLTKVERIARLYLEGHSMGEISEAEQLSPLLTFMALCVARDGFVE